MTSRRWVMRGRTLVGFLRLGVFSVFFIGLFERVEGQGVPAEDQITKLVDALTVASKDERPGVIQSLAKTGDSRVGRVFELYRLGSLYRLEEEVVYYDETEEDEDFYEFALLLDPLTGEPLLDGENQPRKVLIDDLEEVDVSRNERILIRSAEVLLRLSDQDVASRLAAVKRCGQPPRNVEAVPFLKELAVSDPEEVVRYTARESMLLTQFSEERLGLDEKEKIQIAVELGRLKSLRSVGVLEDVIAKEGTESSELGIAAQAAVKRIQAHQKKVNRIGYVVQGLSLGSILVLMALGLAVTFGLMGVINMAHGELMMIGAYATYEMQRLFNHTPDTPSDWYYIAALPASFIAAAAFGWLIEITVVRHLYRRPLESLLATWGVGLILIQLVRVRYGDNIGISSPDWARGGLTVSQDVIIPYARIYILFLCSACVGLVYFVMNRTQIGLKVRAVMQNRDMANSLGVNTHRVDRYTFAFGSGVAGLAGYAWTIIGGVTPDMGQQIFIVDSFLVVVTGGVGELLGVICAGMGIGILTKFVEPLEIGTFSFGPVWAKVVLLIVIVTFIQFKPAGLFAPKGRLSDV
jgi:urea transport system permease protein